MRLFSVSKLAAVISSFGSNVIRDGLIVVQQFFLMVQSNQLYVRKTILVFCLPNLTAYKFLILNNPTMLMITFQKLKINDGSLRQTAIIIVSMGQSNKHMMIMMIMIVQIEVSIFFGYVQYFRLELLFRVICTKIKKQKIIQFSKYFMFGK